MLTIFRNNDKLITKKATIMVAAVAVSSSAGTKKRKSSKTTTTSTNKNKTTFHNKKKNGHQTTTNRNSSSSSSSNKKAKTTTAVVLTAPANNSSSGKPPRRHAEIVERGKILWNSLRRKNITKEERRSLLDELIPLLQNGAKPHEIALQHDGSRLVQAILQFGTAAERSSLIAQLDNDDNEYGNDRSTRNTNNIFVDLAVSQYAHFVVLKIFKYGTLADWQIVTKRFVGHMSILAVHATASKVIEVMVKTVPKQLLAPLQQESTVRTYHSFSGPRR
jgi:pumilio homology domain family member 6